TDPALYDRLYHGVGSHPMTVLAQRKMVEWTGDRSLNQTLERAVSGRDTVILLTDGTSSPLQSPIQTWLTARYGAEPAEKFGADTLVVYRTSLKPVEHPLDLHFGAAITLVGSNPATPTARPGQPLAVTLHWRAAERPNRDYTTSLQLLSPAGKLVAQKDAMPMNNTLPTSGWQPGQDVYDPITLDVPANLPDGDYPLIVVLYDHATGQRLTVGTADHATLGKVHLVGSGG
ncbi:MAG TPA: hypothetical protein VFZ25_04055, partial [Chloroflexota bacterium]|nr:hypothetical protein [Chloroflexota bacterium]